MILRDQNGKVIIIIVLLLFSLFAILGDEVPFRVKKGYYLFCVIILYKLDMKFSKIFEAYAKAKGLLLLLLLFVLLRGRYQVTSLSL